MRPRFQDSSAQELSCSWHFLTKFPTPWGHVVILVGSKVGRSTPSSSKTKNSIDEQFVSTFLRYKWSHSSHSTYSNRIYIILYTVFCLRTGKNLEQWCPQCIKLGIFQVAMFDYPRVTIHLWGLIDFYSSFRSWHRQDQDSSRWSTCNRLLNNRQPSLRLPWQCYGDSNSWEERSAIPWMKHGRRTSPTASTCSCRHICRHPIGRCTMENEDFPSGPLRRRHPPVFPCAPPKKKRGLRGGRTSRAGELCANPGISRTGKQLGPETWLMLISHDGS